MPSLGTVELTAFGADVVKLLRLQSVIAIALAICMRMYIS